MDKLYADNLKKWNNHEWVDAIGVMLMPGLSYEECKNKFDYTRVETPIGIDEYFRQKKLQDNKERRSL